MLKVIDLDAAASSKDADGYVFTLTIGSEKLGIMADEVAELLRARHGAAGKAGAKRAQPKRAATTPADAGQSEGGEPLDSLSESETTELNPGV